MASQLSGCGFSGSSLNILRGIRKIFVKLEEFFLRLRTQCTTSISSCAETVARGGPSPCKMSFFAIGKLAYSDGRVFSLCENVPLSHALFLTKFP